MSEIFYDCVGKIEAETFYDFDDNNDLSLEFENVPDEDTDAMEFEISGMENEIAGLNKHDDNNNFINNEINRQIVEIVQRDGGVTIKNQGLLQCLARSIGLNNNNAMDATFDWHVKLNKKIF